MMLTAGGHEVERVKGMALGADAYITRPFSTLKVVGGWWPGMRIPGADDPERIALGGSIYAEHCASCHGAALEGQPGWREGLPSGRIPAPPHDETGHT